MGLIDDIKNLQPVSNEVIIKEKLIKILNDIFDDVKRENKLLQAFDYVGATKVYKQVDCDKYEFVGFNLDNNSDKIDSKVITPFGIINIKSNKRVKIIKIIRKMINKIIRKIIGNK